MRHYLYLEDRRIAYVCGCFKGGVFTLRAAKTAELTRAGDVQEAAAFLRSAGLAGKSVIAAVGGSETVLREMRLPAASAKITRGMIRNEIAYFRRTAAATAVDMDFLERAGRGKEQHLLAYAMERERLREAAAALKGGRYFLRTSERAAGLYGEVCPPYGSAPPDRRGGGAGIGSAAPVSG